MLLLFVGCREEDTGSLYKRTVDDFIKSKGKHSQKPFGVPVPSSVLYTRGWLGLNCNGKDIENNVHWFTLYYSLSQEKPQPVLSRPVLILLFYVATKPTVLCCAILACTAMPPYHPHRPPLSTHEYKRQCDRAEAKD